MNAIEEGNQSNRNNLQTATFCLMCNSSIEGQKKDSGDSNDELESDGLVLVPDHDRDPLVSDDEASRNPTILSSRRQVTEMQWLSKYQTFLSNAFHVSMDELFDDEEPRIKKLKPEEVIIFCEKCKLEVEKLHILDESVQSSQKAFAQARDSMASAFVRTFVEHKVLQGEDILQDADLEDALSATSEALLEKWRHIFTGEFDKDLKEKNLVADIREDILAKNEWRTKTEFPEGTGLSAMELAKMQRMMTACYFTPKMAIVRKKGKLFFRVGIPRGDGNDPKYPCVTCSRVFPHQRSLNVHMRKHKPPQHFLRHLLHNCYVCGEVFTDRRDLIFHKRNVHGATVEGQRSKYQRFQEVYACGLCSIRFTSKLGRTAHIRKAHANELLFPCNSCHEIFTCRDSLSEHLESVHDQTVITIIDGEDTTTPTVFTCSECFKSFLEIQSYTNHLEVHNDPGTVGCNYCGMGFTSADSLQEHILGVHLNPFPYNCESCEDKFATEEELLEHMKSVVHKTCGAIFRVTDYYKKHLLTHIESSNFCTVCDIGFAESDVYEAHMVQHAGEGKLPFKCNICGDDEGFKDVRDLQKHKLEAHPEADESLPHTCSICWNSYATVDDLNEHNATTHERFKCQPCGKTFKMADHLRRHSFIHTGEKPYHCTVCDKSFNQESNLKEHLNRHTGVRPHKCPHCPDAAYLRRIQLKEHMIKEHGTEEVPTLLMGRAAQNAKKAGTYPNPAGVAPEAEILETTTTPTPLSIVPELRLPHRIFSFSQPVVIKDVTIGDDGVHDRIAPLIMKSLQNNSNQPVIVRRGLQVPERYTPAYNTILIKSEGITSDGQIIEAIEEEPPQPPYAAYL